MEIDLQVTNACNFQCNTCCNSSGSKEIYELSIENIYDILRQGTENGCKQLFLSGGEPLMRNDIFQIIKIAKDFKLDITLLSNGQLISERIAKQLKENGVTRVMLSLDDINSKRNSVLREGNNLSVIDNAIHALRMEEIKTEVNSVISNINKDHYINILLYLASVGISKVRGFYFSPIGRGSLNRHFWITPIDYSNFIRSFLTKYNYLSKSGQILPVVIIQLGYLSTTGKNIPKIISQLNYTNGCQSLYNNRDHIIINSTGQVFSCPILKEYPLGNLNKESLISIITNDDVWKIYNKEIIRKKECSISSLCLEGCIGYSSINSTPNYDCESRCARANYIPLCPLFDIEVNKDSVQTIIEILYNE